MIEELTEDEIQKAYSKWPQRNINFSNFVAFSQGFRAGRESFTTVYALNYNRQMILFKYKDEAEKVAVEMGASSGAYITEVALLNSLQPPKDEA